VAIATWWALSRLTLDAIGEDTRLFVPFFMTFGMGAAFRRGSIGRAIVAAEPEQAPRLQRRFRRALGVTIIGIVIAFLGLAVL
jgi:hypothetical protein